MLCRSTYSFNLPRLATPGSLAVLSLSSSSSVCHVHRPLSSHLSPPDSSFVPGLFLAEFPHVLSLVDPIQALLSLFLSSSPLQFVRSKSSESSLLHHSFPFHYPLHKSPLRRNLTARLLPSSLPSRRTVPPSSSSIPSSSSSSSLLHQLPSQPPRCWNKEPTKPPPAPSCLNPPRTEEEEKKKTSIHGSRRRRVQSRRTWEPISSSMLFVSSVARVWRSCDAWVWER